MGNRDSKGLFVPVRPGVAPPRRWQPDPLFFFLQYPLRVKIGLPSLRKREPCNDKKRTFLWVSTEATEEFFANDTSHAVLIQSGVSLLVAIPTMHARKRSINRSSPYAMPKKGRKPDMRMQIIGANLVTTFPLL
jgi:hypothetical protein